MKRADLLNHVEQTYGTIADYPWQDANAVLRHDLNQKWFGVVMRLDAVKLGMTMDEKIDVLTIKCDPDMISDLLRQDGFYPAYHMNKTNWISIYLDGPITDDNIMGLLGMSYDLTRPKLKRRKSNDISN